MKYTKKEHFKYNDLQALYGDEELSIKLENIVDRNREVYNNLSYYRAVGTAVLGFALEKFFNAKPLGLICYIPAIYETLKKVSLGHKLNKNERMLTLHNANTEYMDTLTKR